MARYRNTPGNRAARVEVVLAWAVRAGGTVTGGPDAPRVTLPAELPNCLSRADLSRLVREWGLVQ
jgi:hypothetical protein